MKRHLVLLVLLVLTFAGRAENRWTMRSDGAIVWRVTKNLPHTDHIELSGQQVSIVLRYGVGADGSLMLNKSMVWPMLRTIPNNTHASLMRRYEWDPVKELSVRGFTLNDERVDSIVFDGTLQIFSHFASCGLGIRRQLAPSTTQPALIERYWLINRHEKNWFRMEIPASRLVYNTDPNQGVKGSYTLVAKTDGAHICELAPGQTVEFSASIQGYCEQKGEKEQTFDAAKEMSQRKGLVEQLQKNLVLESPDEVVNRMFAYSKLRASESIYETAGGPMHGPGGESYYAAIWANDQAEYVNPFFPFEGYEYGQAASLNSYLHFARFMNEKWEPIPSSIIAEGIDIWNGAGDRGDAAMIAYGAARYVLARGDKEEALKLWPLIKWCLEYCHRKLNEGGVVASDRDELEGRFPSGKANLCTSSLYYDALLSASYLCKELGEPSSLAKTYQKQAAQLRKNMETYFGGEVEGFKTYRYYEGNTVLRSWICIPLCMGIYDRAEGTIEALFSPRLWTKDGMLTQAGSKTFWDRSTLYALRGVFAAGRADKAIEFLHYYSNTRLLGEHVPYAIEAWPEGSQRHLSAESGLYARIITEGLFGIRPTGFRSFTLQPEPPHDWNKMALRHVRAFGGDFDIEVERIQKGKLNVTIVSAGVKKNYTVKEGQSILIKL